MTRIGLIAVVAMVVVIGIIAMPSLVHADYAQESCEISSESDYAVIWLDEASKVGQHRPLKYNVQFDPSGVTFRLPPEFYAPDWTQVDDIEMQFDDRESKSGLLRLHMHNTHGSAYVETVGRVQRSCWNDVKKYIHERVDRKGTIVYMSEATAK